MMPMTPLQSWSFLALLFALVIAVVWTIAELERAAARRRAEPAVDADGFDAAADAVSEPEPSRPRLVLVRSEPDRGPTRVYDWAEQDI